MILRMFANQARVAENRHLFPLHSSMLLAHDNASNCFLASSSVMGFVSLRISTQALTKTGAIGSLAKRVKSGSSC